MPRASNRQFHLKEQEGLAVIGWASQVTGKTIYGVVNTYDVFDIAFHVD